MCIRLVDALEDRREKHVIRLGGVVRTGPPAPRDRHDVRDLQPVDRDDVVARTNARRFGFGPDWEADLSQVVLIERNACAAAGDKRRILSRLVNAIPDAGNRPDDRQQKRWIQISWKRTSPRRDRSGMRSASQASARVKLRHSLRNPSPCQRDAPLVPSLPSLAFGGLQDSGEGPLAL